MLDFNEQQTQAIEFYNGACAVIAGAGSGKSTVLVERIRNLVEKHNVKESDILAISFTNNTSTELKNRLSNVGLGNVNTGTFHHVCSKILSENGYDLFRKQPKEWQIENWLSDYEGKKPNVKDIMSFIGFQKNHMRSYNDEFMYKDSIYTVEELRGYYKKYEFNKIKNKLYDFDDYLLECYKILKDKKHEYTWKYVLVDEHQDTNLVQNLLIKEWCKTGNIFCVFDYRQAIYTFRGGNPEYCMNFDKEWDNATIINLDTNYRSNKQIVDNANDFIKRYYGNYEYYNSSIPNKTDMANIQKNTYLSKENESINVVDKVEELLKNNTNPEEIAILYRLNNDSDYIEGQLKKRDISYYISKDSSFFKRTEINLIMSYLRLIENPQDNIAFENIFTARNYPINYFSNDLFKDIKSFAGRSNLSLYEAFTLYHYEKQWQSKNARILENTIEKLRLQKDKHISICKMIDNIKMSFCLDEFIENKYTDEEEQTNRLNSIETLKSFVKGDNLQSFINYAYNASMSKSKTNTKDCIKLMTIHASKGLEFKHVFIVGIEDGKFPNVKSSLIEEARLFYVGITRPKENLYINEIGHNNQFVNEYFNC